MNPTIQVGGITIELTTDQLAQIDKQRMVKPINPLEITSYPMVCDILGVSSSDKSIRIEADGFSPEEINVLRNIAMKLRICKVLNGGYRFKRGDKRWYSWYDVSLGFVFSITYDGGTSAYTSSASSLCFLNAQIANHFVKHFKHIDEAIIDL